jgi:hypothetical protein
MMFGFVPRAVACVMFVAACAFALSLAAAQAGERDELNACKARIAQSQGAPAVEDNPELAKCRQIIKEWTLRDSRRSVDEDGRPLR